MTAKDKARDLVDKFRNEFKWVEKDYQIDLYRDTRQCALIAVGELIKSYETNIQKGWIGTVQYDNIKFWNDVKEEINKL